MLRWRVAGLAIAVIGCGGYRGPAHSGYRTDRATPWKKPTLVVFDDKGQATLEGELDYAAYARARWYAIDLAEPGDLELELEAEADDANGDDAPDTQIDVALEVFDPSFQIVAHADADDEDAYESTKGRTLLDLRPGRYLVHLYLQSRLARADYDLDIVFRAKAVDDESDFPARVAYLPRLPQVPLWDDAPPITGRVKIARVRGGKTRGTPESIPDVATIKAAVIDVVVSGPGSIITMNRGTDHRLGAGMRGYLRGAKDSTFVLSSCGERRCKATVKATPDQVSRAGSVFIIDEIR
jgi:hypothetical protein